MTVIALSGCKSALRGDLTKWFLEIDTGVYIGNISARVRDELWRKITDNIGSGRAIMVFNAHNEQGFSFKIVNAKRIPADFEGLNLIITLGNKDAVIKKRIPARKRIVKKCSLSLFGKPDTYVILDTETTGLDRSNDRVIEIGAVKVIQGKIVDRFQRLINIDRILPQVIVELTSITDEDLKKEGVSEVDALTAFREFVGDLPLIAHNISFDMAFLNNACQRNEMERFDNRQIDTIKIARKEVKGVENYSLGTLLHFYNIPLTPCHRALQDCMCVNALLNKLIKNT